MVDDFPQNGRCMAKSIFERCHQRIFFPVQRLELGPFIIQLIQQFDDRNHDVHIINDDPEDEPQHNKENQIDPLIY